MQLRLCLLVLSLHGVLTPAAAQTVGRVNGTPPVVIRAVETELAGNPLDDDPAFEFVQSFNQGSEVWIAIDPFLHPELVGVPVDVYVVANRTQAAWFEEPGLLDVAGGPRTITFGGASIRDNRRPVDAGGLSGQGGLGIGIPYDVVIDLDRDGELSDGDRIDGLTRRGFHVVQDLTLPGPLAVSEHQHISSTAFRNQMIYYPTSIGTLGELPLVVVSHGNGHNYQWYGHIGRHLASWGYVVTSHENETGPGIESASQTTLDNTDYLLAHQATVVPDLDGDGHGELDGHVDAGRITWIGHSRGGEGIVRALGRLRDAGDPNPASFATYDAEDVQLLSSLAPTAFGTGDSHGTLALPDPGDVTYSLWTGAADKDVKNCALNTSSQSFHLHDRADQTRLSIALYGAGHDDFHDGNYVPVAKGPCLIGRDAAHAILRGYLLALVKTFLEGEVGARDYLWRPWESFRPIGAPSVTCSDPPFEGTESVVVNLQFRPGADQGTFVLDDFQSAPSVAVSSSGGAVWGSVQEYVEGRFDDTNSHFWQEDPVTGYRDPLNGVNLGGELDDAAGVGFSFTGDSVLAFEVPAARRDLSAYRYLSFRAAQGTRHPNTVPPDFPFLPRWEGHGELADLTFSIRLRSGTSSTKRIRAEAIRAGLEEPYQRLGCDALVPAVQGPQPRDPLRGWATEFETVRLRLADFRSDASGIDLTDVTSVELLFGPSHGSAVGRVFLDDLQFEAE